MVGIIVSFGFAGLYIFTPKATPPQGVQEDVGGTFQEEMLKKAESCDKFCKDKYSRDGWHIIGKLKTTPDNENIRCECYQKRLSNNKIEI